MCKKLIYLCSFVLVLGLTTTVANADISDGLVAHWPLDEGQGTTTADLSGNGNHGTFIDTPGWDSGKFGGALDFDGIDDVVDCGLAPELNFRTGDFSISLWVKVSVDPGPDTRHVFQKGDDDFDNWAMEFRDNDGGDIEFEIEDGTDHKVDTDDPHGTGLIDDEWHHIVMMRETVKLRVYVDGAEDMGVAAEGASNIPADYDIDTSLGPAYIGANYDKDKIGVGENFFLGLIDDVAVWNRALTVEEINYLWNNGDGNPIDVSDPALASNPYPANEEPDAPYKVVLSWTPGIYAAPTNGHKVYLGESFNDVNDATGAGAQTATSYTPAPRLDLGRTYYWRVDEVNAPPTSHIEFKGEVWSFTTEPVAYAIENITATASSAHSADMSPENTINGSGLDANDLHSNEPTDMWLSGSEPLGAWIEYDFDKVYKLHEMWVWNSNQTIESLVGFGLKDVTIEHSANGTDYTTLTDVLEFAQAPGADGYAHNTTVDFGGAAAKYVKLTANSNWGMLPQYGLSEVRFLYIPIRAREASPDSGESDVNPDVVLGWRAGREAAQHDVYVSTDEQAVIDGTAPVISVTEASHGPLDLDLGQTYYWRVDEVNEAETPATWQGDLWDFTTQEYFVVDDFESYNDLDPGDPASKRIFNVWIDGYGIPTNGSIVGYEIAPFAEQSIVHGGEQSMPLSYSNTGGAAYSEAERTFAVGQNWTQAGAATFVLYFHGAEGNTGQLYVKVDGSKVVYDGDAGDIAKVEWKQWNIDLASLGVNLQNITKLAIGIDGNGATGTLYVDDIRLYRLAPEPQAN